MKPRGAAIVGLCVAALALLVACWGRGPTPDHPTGVTTTATGTATATTTALSQGGDEVPTGGATATMAEGSSATPGPLFPEPSAIPPSPSTPDSPGEPVPPLLTEPVTPSPSPTEPSPELVPELIPEPTLTPAPPTVTTTTGQ